MNKELGMTLGKARNILVKRLMWKMICDLGLNSCHVCGKEMCSETYSIEHKEPWRYSKDPEGLYFDLDNISFSHHSCNSSAARRHIGKKPYDEKEYQRAYKKRMRSSMTEEEKKAERRERYLKTGK